MSHVSQIAVSADVLRSTNMTLEQLQQHLIELKRMFGSRFPLIVPQKIDGVPALYWIVNLSQRLQKLKGCDGFDRHARTYSKEQRQSSYFVTLVASILVDKVDEIFLEPSLIGKTTKPDILVHLGGEQVYLECKHTVSLKCDYAEEHERMFLILSKYINVPHQVSIQYRKSLSDSELHQLGAFLKERLSLVTGDGRIISNSDLEVQVSKRDAFGDKRFRLIMTMIAEDIDEKCKYPGHVYVAGGITMAFSGPKLGYQRILRDKMRESKLQSPHNCAFVLVIDNAMILGSMSDNVRALSTAFQPQLNTRFSAAVLVDCRPKLDSPNVNVDFYFISNPFAKFPVSNKFGYLFPSSSTV